MRKFENECCDCAVPGYPCLGSACSNRHVFHVYCDGCDMDFEDEDIFVYNGKDLCAECFAEEVGATKTNYEELRDE